MSVLSITNNIFEKILATRCTHLPRKIPCNLSWATWIQVTSLHFSSYTNLITKLNTALLNPLLGAVVFHDVDCTANSEYRTHYGSICADNLRQLNRESVSVTPNQVMDVRVNTWKNVFAIDVVRETALSTLSKLAELAGMNVYSYIPLDSDSTTGVFYDIKVSISSADLPILVFDYVDASRWWLRHNSCVSPRHIPLCEGNLQELISSLTRQGGSL